MLRQEEATYPARWRPYHRGEKKTRVTVCRTRDPKLRLCCATPIRVCSSALRWFVRDRSLNESEIGMRAHRWPRRGWFHARTDQILVGMLSAEQMQTFRPSSFISDTATRKCHVNSRFPLCLFLVEDVQHNPTVGSSCSCIHSRPDHFTVTHSPTLLLGTAYENVISDLTTHNSAPKRPSLKRIPRFRLVCNASRTTMKTSECKEP